MTKEELKQLILEISEVIGCIEKVYHYRETGRPHELQSLFFLVSDNMGASFTEMRESVNVILDPYPNINYAFILRYELIKALSEGHLFYLMLCTGDHLLFEKTDIPALPTSYFENIKEYQISARNCFNIEMKKAVEFLEGGYFYFHEDNLRMTSFMLHQAVEMTFRAIELAILRRQRPSHDIKAHHGYLKIYTPHISNIFSLSTENDISLLSTLNKSYSDVRYKRSYSMSRENIQITFERTIELQKEASITFDYINKFIDDFSQVFDKDVSTVNIEEVDISEANKVLNQVGQDQNEILFEIFRLIKEKIQIDSIYCYGTSLELKERNSLFKGCSLEPANYKHYNLLAISSHINPYSEDLQTRVNDILGIQVTITLIIHPIEEVKTRLKSNNYFFCRVMQKENLIFGYHSPDIQNCYVESPIKNFSNREQIGKLRFDRARCCAQFADLMKETDQSAAGIGITINLLSEGIEQACLGLIYLFLGYHPNNFRLSHLTNLCRHFWSEIDVYLQLNHIIENTWIRSLAETRSNIRYKASNVIEPKDFDFLYNKATIFIENAEAFFLAELQKQDLV